MSQLTDNEVLADFMEVRHRKIDFYKDKPLEVFIDGRWVFPGYSENWSRLMPVWYKFRDLKFDEVANQIEHSNIRTVIGAAILNEGPTPAAACALLANAIRWYQSVKK